MKAIVQHRYGSPDELALAEVPRPTPGPGELLVRVRAASVNAADWHMMRGDPRVMRLFGGLGRKAPAKQIRGRDVSGEVVEAVGVEGFSIGDEVYADTGERESTFAEYVCVPAAYAAPKPPSLTHEQAAATPLAGTTALVGLRDHGRIEAGQRILINGASGGVGTFAVQLGKAFHAEVTAVCSTRNVELVRKLGADHVVDYRAEDFARGGERYDVVLDLVGNRSLADLRRVLAPAGALVLSGGGTFDGGSFFGPMSLMMRGSIMARFAGQQRIARLEFPPDGKNLAQLTDLIEDGKVTPEIDRTYPLAEAPEAVRYLESEHARAKVVITAGQ